jgi:hypothetical protein
MHRREKAGNRGQSRSRPYSTSYAERSSLSMRTFMRRFTRLALGFSKKFENHCHMVSLYTVWYNFVKQHKSLKGLTRQWRLASPSRFGRWVTSWT